MPVIHESDIAVTRYLASRDNNEDHGTIIFNPGGPGGSGTASTWRIGPLLDKILQGQYDVVGFDPRGINMTFPRVDCFHSIGSRRELEKILTITAPSLNLHDVGIWDAYAQLIAQECEEHSGADILPFVNTPTVARDIASIVNALHAERRHRVSYWGFSYGTNLGAIFTAMFPNKLHKIILDGIRSPFDARELYQWGYTSLASQDDVMEGYFEICDKVGESRCALAGSKKGSKKTVMDFLSALYDRPLPLKGGDQIGLVTFYAFKTFLYGTLYRPQSWPMFAKVTEGLLQGNTTAFLETISPRGEAYDQAASGMAVLCTDAVPATNYSLASWKDFVKNATKLSFIAGDGRSLDTLPCRHWTSLPNERWEGSFDNVHLEAPVLMIGNTYDPATPLASAKRLAAKMGHENVRLLEQHSYGHCSISSVSTCTWNATLSYLLNGDLPEHDKVCEVDDSEYGDYFPHNDRGESSLSLFQQLEAAIL
ncbi:hypothetical protein MMC10_002871 [Thelotrema lepadinum]|nr:hypothetical protein [Thelotrema lepadinum]